MPVNANPRRGIYPKRWESGPLTPPSLILGYLNLAPDLTCPQQEVINLPNLLLFNPKKGVWVPLPTSPLSGLGSSGACGVWHPNGPTGTTSAATANTITTNLTPARDLAGYTIRLTGGAGAGQERVVSSNTLGANTKLTVTQAWAVQPDNTTTWLLRSGRYWVIGAGSSITFAYFDLATWSWSSLLAIPVAGVFGLEASLAATCFSSFLTNQVVTSATSTTLTTSGKSWASSQWVNYQVRITGGKGAGQVRVITASTANQLTVATWTTTPDNTSIYTIEGNEDALYFTGGGSSVFYKYVPSTNTWSSLAPRPRTVTTACLLHIDRDPTPVWSAEADYLNGRYLYSFRCGGSAVIDRYNLTTDVWDTVTCSPPVVFNTGSSFVYVNGKIYAQKETTSGATSYSWYRFIPSTNVLEPFGTLVPAPPLLVSAGARIFASSFTDSYGFTYYYLWQLSPTGVSGVNPLYRVQEIPLCPHPSIFGQVSTRTMLRPPLARAAQSAAT